MSVSSTELPAQSASGISNDIEAAAAAASASAPCLRRMAIAMLCIGVTASWAAALGLMRYGLPAQSDWGRITRWGDDGPHPRFWDYLFHYFYLRWQGRWASAGLEAYALSADPIHAYPLLLIGVAAVDLIAAYLVCRWFTRRSSPLLAVAMAICGLGVLWAGLPSVAEAVNWFNGAVENNLTLSLAAMLLVGTAATTRRSGIFSTIAALVLALFGLVICGFHELFGLMLCITLATALVGAWIGGDGQWRTWAIVLAGAAIGLAIVVVAPGNHFRMVQETTPHSRQLRYDAILTLRLMAHFIPQWLLDPKLIAASLWVAFSPALEAGRVPWTTGRRVPWRWVLPGLCAVLMAVGFFFPCWVFGNKVPPRTLSGDYVAFFGLWLLIVYVWTRAVDVPPALIVTDATGQLARPLEQMRWASAPAPTTAAALLMGAAILLSGNVPVLAHDLISRVRPWHAAAMRRYETLRGASDRSGTVVVPPLPHQPLSMPWIEISADAKDWHNVLMAYFFHVHAVVLRGPTSQPNPQPASSLAEPIKP